MEKTAQLRQNCIQVRAFLELMLEKLDGGCWVNADELDGLVCLTEVSLEKMRETDRLFDEVDIKEVVVEQEA